MIKEGQHSCVEAGLCLQGGALMQHDNGVLETASHHHTYLTSTPPPISVTLKPRDPQGEECTESTYPVNFCFSLGGSELRQAAWPGLLPFVR